jgi:hypothetical protein
MCSSSRSSACAISGTLGLAIELLRQRSRRTVDPQRHLVQAARRAHRPAQVAEMAFEHAERAALQRAQVERVAPQPAGPTTANA